MNLSFKCFCFFIYFLPRKAKITLKEKSQKKIKASMKINSLNVLDKLGSFNKPKLCEINNIMQKAINEIERHIPNKARPSFLLLVIK